MFQLSIKMDRSRLLHTIESWYQDTQTTQQDLNTSPEASIREAIARARNMREEINQPTPTWLALNDNAEHRYSYSSILFKLTRFLENHHYPDPFPKLEASIDAEIESDEFSRMFEFIVRILMPDFRISQLDSDVQDILNLFDYPWPVPKNYHYPNTKLNLYNVLHKLHWLLYNLELVDEYDMVNPFGPEDRDLQIIGLCLRESRTDEMIRKYVDRRMPTSTEAEKEEERLKAKVRVKLLSLHRKSRDDKSRLELLQFNTRSLNELQRPFR